MSESPTRNSTAGVVIVAPQGRLNMMVAPHLRAQLHALVEGGNSRLVIDLAGVESVDSSGLGALISGLKAARQAGGDLRIAAAHAQVMAVLELTNLNRVLRTYESADSAFDEPD